ncbi:Uncharacterised protein [Mycobacteroides abscessus subsp. massiliense]|nr:Uncharacterised protein [Mycobacteroides abscessus subsp. massiliense]
MLRPYHYLHHYYQIPFLEYLQLYQYHVEYHLNLYIHVHDHCPKI